MVHGTPKHKNLWDVDFNGQKGRYVGGNEGHGIPGHFEANFDDLAFVPSIDKETGAYNISNACSWQLTKLSSLGKGEKMRTGD